MTVWPCIQLPADFAQNSTIAGHSNTHNCKKHGWGARYTPAAYRVFPRYLLDEAIQARVEAMTSEDLSSVEKTRLLLLDAGEQAFKSLVQKFDAPDALDVLDQEWNTFVEYITSRGSRALENVEPLPCRRVLTNSESTRLRGTLASRWGVCGCWYPLSKVEPHVNVIAFHTDHGNGEEVKMCSVLHWRNEPSETASPYSKALRTTKLTDFSLIHVLRLRGFPHK